ncbi:type I secretion C-terminal target domain-containing protein [Azoarcus sp. PA01]|nr:type I secretion C-terminal target domain-containing protein [Azoarcus sp. PA01]
MYGSATLDGGTGNDTLTLDSGTVATGGADNDHFIAPYFYAYEGWQEASVTDFKSGEDKIDVSSLLSSYTLAAYQGGNPFEQQFLRLTQDSNDTLLQIDIDGTASEQGFVTVIRLTGVTAIDLTADDFLPIGAGPSFA